MGYILSNAVAILAATLASLVVGIAYGMVGRDRPIVPGGGGLGLLALAFVAEFWLAAILAGALILAPPQANPWVMALASAVVIWIGFVVPTLLVTQRHRGQRVGASLRDCAHWLAAMLVQAAVLHMVGLIKPQ